MLQILVHAISLSRTGADICKKQLYKSRFRSLVIAISFSLYKLAIKVTTSSRVHIRIGTLYKFSNLCNASYYTNINAVRVLSLAGTETYIFIKQQLNNRARASISSFIAKHFTRFSRFYFRKQKVYRSHMR